MMTLPSELSPIRSMIIAYDDFLVTIRENCYSKYS